MPAVDGEVLLLSAALLGLPQRHDKELLAMGTWRLKGRREDQIWLHRCA